MTYRSREVLDFRPTFDTPEHGQLDDHSYDAPTQSVAIPWKVTSGPKRTLKLPFLIDGYENLKPFRAFLSGREGRRRGFWVPTWITDYAVTQDESAGSLTIRIKWIGLGTKLAFSAQFRHIALLTWKKMEFYRIDDSVIDGDEEELTLDRALDTDLVARETVGCGLLFARFADDEFELEYRAGDVISTDLTFVELPRETEGTEHEGTKPIYLYLIQQGATVVRLTNYPVGITIGADTWDAAVIEHGELTENIDFTSDPFNLTMATDDEDHPLRNLLSPAFIGITTLEIYESDADNPLPEHITDGPFYKGRIESVRYVKKGEMHVQVSSHMRVSEEQVPQATLERQCQHHTYDTFCTLNPALFVTTAAITALNANPPYIEAAAFGAKATAEADPNWFALGLVTIGSEQRFCTGQVGNRLYLNAPFKFAIVGNNASALAGDDKRPETCDGKFNNILNFFGAPYMPNQNPQYEMLTAPKPSGGKK